MSIHPRLLVHYLLPCFLEAPEWSLLTIDSRRGDDDCLHDVTMVYAGFQNDFVNVAVERLVR